MRLWKFIPASFRPAVIFCLLYFIFFSSSYTIFITDHFFSAEEGRGTFGRLLGIAFVTLIPYLVIIAAYIAVLNHELASATWTVWSQTRYKERTAEATKDCELKTLWATGLWAPLDTALFWTPENVVPVIDPTSPIPLGPIKRKNSILQPPGFTLPLFPSLTAVPTDQRLGILNFGGQQDAERYAQVVVSACEEAEKKNRDLLTKDRKETKFILAGHSQGSVAVFNALTILVDRPDYATKIRPYIAFVIFLCPFGEPLDVVQNVTGSDMLTAKVFFFLRGKTGYQQHWSAMARLNKMSGLEQQEGPQHLLKKNPGVPLAFVWSKDDSLVPSWSSTNLFHTAKAQYPELCTALVLQRTEHDLNLAREIDRKLLATFVLGLIEEHIPTAHAKRMKREEEKDKAGK